MERGCQVMGSFWLFTKVNEKSPRASARAWNQNTPFLSLPWRADEQHTTCKEEEKGLWGGLCNVPSTKKNPTNQQATTRGRKEGEGVREAMSPRCWEAKSEGASERGHLCPCRSHYRCATRPVTQCTEARVISRTDNWTLILVDVVAGMICQADRAYAACVCWSAADEGDVWQIRPGASPPPSWGWCSC